jgi:hypothetical protein
VRASLRALGAHAPRQNASNCRRVRLAADSGVVTGTTTHMKTRTQTVCPQQLPVSTAGAAQM